MTKTLFVASGPVTWASARMRCHWPAQFMQDAQVVTGGEHNSIDAQNVIFQKIFDGDYAKIQRRIGRKVFWDVCDPAWWWSSDACREILRNVDGVVCSSEALQADFDQWSLGVVPSYTIPDRLELDHFPLQRQHQDVTPVRLIWFGLAVNRHALLGALTNLERLVCNGYPIALTILDDRPDQVWTNPYFPIYHAQWSLERENEIIASHDIAILPPYPGPWGTVKSNNKRLTAWACGLPVTDGFDYERLEEAMGVDFRRVVGAAGRESVEQNWTADLSARDWEAILC
jgi:hypothetical protein